MSFHFSFLLNLKQIRQCFLHLLDPITRYSRAERDLKGARPYGVGATKFFAVAEIEPPKENPKELLIAMTSDRGNHLISFTNSNQNINEDFFDLFL